MESADRYRRMIEAVDAQAERVQQLIDQETRWEHMAGRFRVDPRRDLDPNTRAIAEYLQPGDALVDVGGGAGRVCLPLARRCREVVNVEPSKAMGREFMESAAEGGVSNARIVPARWMEAEVEGDVAVVANVTYFVADIVPFIEKLNREMRRRVIVCVWSTPPPMRNAPLFELAHREPQARCPGHRELLDVLWDMGLLPDVRVLPGPFTRHGAKSPEAVIDGWLQDTMPRDPDTCRARLEPHIAELTEQTESGYIARRPAAMREMLITWQTRQGPGV